MLLGPPPCTPTAGPSVPGGSARVGGRRGNSGSVWVFLFCNKDVKARRARGCALGGGPSGRRGGGQGESCLLVDHGVPLLLGVQLPISWWPRGAPSPGQAGLHRVSTSLGPMGGSFFQVSCESTGCPLSWVSWGGPPPHLSVVHRMPLLLGIHGVPHLLGIYGVPHFLVVHRVSHLPGIYGVPHLLVVHGVSHLPGIFGVPHPSVVHTVPHLLVVHGVPHLLGIHRAPHLPAAPPSWRRRGSETSAAGP